MPLSVLIPSHGRPEKLRACLASLALQEVAPAEVVVGLDGGSEADANAVTEQFGPSLPGLRVLSLPWRGYIPTRATLLAECRSDRFLSLNDDVTLSPSVVRAHAETHDREPGEVLVTGPAPWRQPQKPTVFDELVARSDLIFFDPAPALQSGSRLPYRYCVGLNFSMRAELARSLGGFHDLPRAYGYDDVELAHRATTRAGAEVVFSPDAIVTHDHAYTPEEVERREYRLGRAAWMYRHVNEAFAADLFGRDIADPAELAFCREVLARERPDAERIERSFLALGQQPASSLRLNDPLPAMLAEHWVLLKRYLWRWGLLDAAEGRDERFGPLSGAPSLL
ncbi:MAG: glycosyltransferase [Planctomycetota bacterium]